MNYQNLPAQRSPKQHCKHARNTGETWPCTFQHPRLDHRRLSHPGVCRDQRRDLAWCHQKGPRTYVRQRAFQKHQGTVFLNTLASSTVHLHVSQAVWQQSLWRRHQALHLTHQTPSPPFSPLQTSHPTAEELASLWPYFTSTSGPPYNWQWKHLIPFQSLRFSSILIYILILDGRGGEDTALSKQN